MITQTEKRIRDLEEKARVQEILISELSKKEDASASLQKELKEFKAVLDKLYQDINAQNLQDIREKGEIIANIEQLQQAALKPLRLIAEIQRLIDENRLIAQIDRKRLDELVQQLAEYRDREKEAVRLARQADGRSSQAESDIAKSWKHLADMELVCQNAKQDAALAILKAKEAEKSFSEHEANVKAHAPLQTQFLKEMNFREEKLLHCIPPQAKSYDAELAEIRKDIATVLATLPTMTKLMPPSTPPASREDDKIKELEKAIAQIFTLLKKYER